MPANTTILNVYSTLPPNIINAPVASNVVKEVKIVRCKVLLILILTKFFISNVLSSDLSCSLNNSRMRSNIITESFI